jgi:metal-responsive CopG/Arc/MetJ family transcriptional regulator
MATKKHGSTEIKNSSVTRASVTFPPDLYKTLEDIAKQKKVSVAWVVRDAAEKYVADQWPLFKGTQQ